MREVCAEPGAPGNLNYDARCVHARFRAAPVLLGALIVAIADLGFAIAFWHGRVPAIRILQSIAAGLLGRTASRAGGVGTALLGGVLHAAIATVMAFTYVLLARRVPALVRHASPFGAIYGVLLYLAMNFVVLPLSAVGMPSFANHTWVVWSIAMHVLFGLVFAHAARIASR
jgi:hypothetical protein